MDVNDPSHKTPGQLITALLEARGWTKRATATILGISEPALNKMASDTLKSA
jgi:plasmid maintenance system antidote protein VapI